MVQRFASLVFGLCVFATASAARAASCETYYVVPGKPGVQVVINYHDARWRVVESECGLGRPGHISPVVIGGSFVGPLRGEIKPSGYYPKTGQKPLQGRDESEPPADRPAPPAAENFSRSWSTPTVEPVPADLPNTNPNMNNGLGEGMPIYPQVIVPPQRPRPRPPLQR